MKNNIFDQILNKEELCAWTSLKVVINGFLGNQRAENAELLVNDLLRSYKKMGCRMSLKFTSSTLISLFSHQILEQSVMNKGNDFIRM